MNALLPIVFLMMLQVSSSQPSGQVVGLISADQVAVMNLAIGSPRSKVLSALGKPVKTRRGYDTEMGMGKWEQMDFPGLIIEVSKPEPTKENPGQKEAYVW